MSILDAFSRRYVTSVPVEIDLMIAVRIRFENDEIGSHQVMVDVTDTDGRSLGKYSAGIFLQSQLFRPTATLSIVHPLMGVSIQVCGEYSIAVKLDENQPVISPFYVHLLQ